MTVAGVNCSADCKRGRRKGATSNNVKNRQKVSKSFSTLFDNFRAAPFFWPLLQSAELFWSSNRSHCDSNSQYSVAKIHLPYNLFRLHPSRNDESMSETPKQSYHFANSVLERGWGVERTAHKCCLPWEAQDKQSVRTLAFLFFVFSKNSKAKTLKSWRNTKENPNKDNTKENRNTEEEKGGGLPSMGWSSGHVGCHLYPSHEHSSCHCGLCRCGLDWQALTTWRREKERPPSGT